MPQRFGASRTSARTRCGRVVGDRLERAAARPRGRRDARSGSRDTAAPPSAAASRARAAPRSPARLADEHLDELGLDVAERQRAHVGERVVDRVVGDGRSPAARRRRPRAPSSPPTCVVALVHRHPCAPPAPPRAPPPARPRPLRPPPPSSYRPPDVVAFAECVQRRARRDRVARDEQPRAGALDRGGERRVRAAVRRRRRRPRTGASEPRRVWTLARHRLAAGDAAERRARLERAAEP